MFAKLNHLAIVSENYAMTSRFYEAVFGMKGASEGRVEGAAVVGDGYVGMNINPRVPGRGSRLEHFGFEVKDVETALGRLRDFPEVQWLKRPSNRPFAGISAHDPDGNVFDISQTEMENRADVYVEQEASALHPRHISHFALRTMRPDMMAEFYRKVFELEPRNKRHRHHAALARPYRLQDREPREIQSRCRAHQSAEPLFDTLLGRLRAGDAGAHRALCQELPPVPAPPRRYRGRAAGRERGLDSLSIVTPAKAGV